MRVNEFLDIAGNYLQEDFSTSPVWTKDELLGCVRQVYRQFCVLTGLVDKTEIRLINGTTGEADVPKDFESLYFAQHEQRHLDIVKLDELDFVSGTWLGGTTGTPNAVSVIGSGDNAAVRYVPVPSSVWAGGSDSTLDMTAVYLTGGGNQYLVDVVDGILRTTLAVGADNYPVIASPSGNRFMLLVTTNGELHTFAMPVGTAVDYVGLTDASSDLIWELTCTDSGELVTTPEYAHIGLATAALIDNATYQDFDTEYGIVVDMYADGSTTSPAYVGRVNSSRGLSLYAYTSDEAGMLWYKGALPELGSLYSELKLSSGFLPVILHGVLSLAYAHNGDGRDPQKAELLSQVFIAECEAIKRGFEFRWA